VTAGGLRVACDSLVALADVTADGGVLFAKNSDRVPPTECQPLVQVARQRHAPGTRLRCQYLDIAQVRETACAIGSRPFWLWGFEHGLNEHGVAIGNHTVFTKDELGGPGLIGMDLVRLGLERGTSASHAVEVLTALIERHGQGGSGYMDKDWPYHNSFMIADRTTAFLLETSDRRWAVRRVRVLGSASNHLSIGEDWDALAPGTVAHAVARGWWRADDPRRFDFAAAFRDASVAPAFISSGRLARTCELLERARGRVTPASLWAALRDHYESGPTYRPGRSWDDPRSYSICQHVPAIGTTTASVVARLGPSDEPLVYWGSLGSPCVGVFLPYYVEGVVPAVLARGGASPSADAPWWQFHQLLGQVARDFERWGPYVRARWDAFEADVEAARPATEARARRDGAAVLTAFMETNVRTMREHLAALIAATR
jgi:secernin